MIPSNMQNSIALCAGIQNQLLDRAGIQYMAHQKQKKCALNALHFAFLDYKIQMINHVSKEFP